jgi:DNA-directed RNA polymerase subunit RPC12/RpoP
VASNDLYVTILEERAALAQGSGPVVVRCPYCSSPRLREVGEAKPKEVRTPRGVVVMRQQTLRCRDCSRSFSPAAS